MQDIINFIVNGIISMFSILENFEFLGTNMLKFSLTILILGTLLPVLLTLTHFRVNNTASYKEKMKGEEKK